LLDDFAAQAGLVLRNVRLTAELASSLEAISAQASEIRASRRRIVATQDERAKKLERNIHDGAQQQLVALAVKQRLVADLIDKNPEQARAMAEQLQADTHDALENLRDLARGIYPPLLADKGLVAALQGQARKAAIPTDVRVENVGRYAQDVEAAVYFCTLEALNNVAKYSGATRAEVRLAQTNGELTFEIIDDGAGFDPSETGYGTGLQGMADRLDALGGTLEVRSSPGAGTTITGRVEGAEKIARSV
jgi:signal transduction histidine kinase